MASTARTEGRIKDCSLFTSMLTQVAGFKQALRVVWAHPPDFALRQMARAHTAQSQYP